MSRNSAVGIATDYGLYDQEIGVQIGRKNFLFCMSSRLALRLTQPPIQWVIGAFPQELSGQGVKLTTHLQPVPRSRKCGSIYPLLHTILWRSA
jgi:hypothetical protein